MSGVYRPISVHSAHPEGIWEAQRSVAQISDPHSQTGCDPRKVAPANFAQKVKEEKRWTSRHRLPLRGGLERYHARSLVPGSGIRQERAGHPDTLQQSKADLRMPSNTSPIWLTTKRQQRVISKRLQRRGAQASEVGKAISATRPWLGGKPWEFPEDGCRPERCMHILLLRK